MISCTFEEFEDLLEADTAKLVAKLYSFTDISRKRSHQIMELVQTLILQGGAISNLKNNVLSRLKVLGEGKDGLNSVEKKFNMFSNPFQKANLNSEYSIIKYFTEKGTLIMPKQILIAERDEFKKVDSVQALVTVPVTVEMVPLHLVFKQFFQLPNMFDDMLRYLEYLDKNDDIVSNFVQAEYWKRLKLSFDENQLVLPLFLYYDDFETNDALGSHAGNSKCGAVYVSIPCPPPQHQSKVDNIMVFLMFNTLDKKQYGN